MSHLEELLARATALEAKAAKLVESRAVPAAADLTAETDSALVAVLEEKIAQLEDTIDLLAASSAPGEDPVADRDAAGAEAFVPVEPVAAEDLLDDDEEFDAEAFAAALEAEAAAEDEDEEKGFDFEDPADLDDLDLEAKGDPAGGGKGKEKEKEGGRVSDEERDYVRDAIGQFASDGNSDSEGGGSGGRSGSSDPDDYELESLQDVRDLLHNWTEVPGPARAELKKRLEALVKDKATDEHGRERLLALVGGLGDGDGKAEAGEGVGRAMAEGHGGGNDWLRENGKGRLAKPPSERHKNFDDDLEAKELVTLSEIELLQARRAQLDA